jgi:hypothetical protein
MGETKSKYLKLNTDAALNIYDLTGASDSIIRDNLGNLWLPRVTILHMFHLHLWRMPMLKLGFSMQFRRDITCWRPSLTVLRLFNTAPEKIK